MRLNRRKPPLKALGALLTGSALGLTGGAVALAAEPATTPSSASCTTTTSAPTPARPSRSRRRPGST
ncbi:hypothetical protein [Micromonospora zhanjiangensis]